MRPETWSTGWERVSGEQGAGSGEGGLSTLLSSCLWPCLLLSGPGREGSERGRLWPRPHSESPLDRVP